MPGAHEPLTDALLDPATYAGDLHAVLDRLRAEAPLAWNGTKGFWAVTRHADVTRGVERPAPLLLVEGDPRRRDRRHLRLAADDDARRPAGAHPLPEAGPTRVHQPVVRAARGARARAHRRRPRRARRQGRRRRGRRRHRRAGRAAADPAHRPAARACPQGDEERLFRWSEAAIPGATDWSEDERMRAARRDDRRAPRPGRGPAGGAPRRRRVDARRPTRRTASRSPTTSSGMFLIQLLVAGNETTRNAISGALVALAEHPEQLDRLAADPALLPTAVEEVLRWTTPVTSFMRTAVDDTELGGTPIAAGDPLLLIYAAANRDEAEFGPTAGTFDVGRSPEPPRRPRPRPALLPRRRAGPPRADRGARGRRRALAPPRGGRPGRAQRLVGDLRHQGGPAHAGGPVSELARRPPRHRHRRWRRHRRGHRPPARRPRRAGGGARPRRRRAPRPSPSEIGGHAFTVDVADPDATTAAVHAAADAMGGLTDVIANAGIGLQQAAARATRDKEWRLVVGVNLDGTFHTLRAAIPILLEAGGGNLVTVATLNATRPLQGEAPVQRRQGRRGEPHRHRRPRVRPHDPGQLRVARDDRHRPHVGDHRRPRASRPSPRPARRWVASAPPTTWPR